MKMPSQEEQTIAEKYVLERPLTRPDTNAKKAIKYCFGYMILTVALGVAVLHLFDCLGFFALFPERFNEFRWNRPLAFYVAYFAGVFTITGLCCLRSAAIGCVKLYQHYAPEHIRRRCLFMPTCSEYAILAIKKNGVIVGLIKTYIRVFKKCRGNIYRIDYP